MMVWKQDNRYDTYKDWWFLYEEDDNKPFFLFILPSRAGHWEICFSAIRFGDRNDVKCPPEMTVEEVKAMALMLI